MRIWLKCKLFGHKKIRWATGVAFDPWISSNRSYGYNVTKSHYECFRCRKILV